MEKDVVEKDVVFTNYLYRIGFVQSKYDILEISKEEMIAGLNNILKDASDDYLKCIISARQIQVITRFIYYYETRESED